MKNLIPMFVAFLMMLTFESCEAIGGIFKAGVWVGVVAVVAVVALIIFLFTRGKK